MLSTICQTLWPLAQHTRHVTVSPRKHHRTDGNSEMKGLRRVCDKTKVKKSRNRRDMVGDTSLSETRQGGSGRP